MAQHFIGVVSLNRANYQISGLCGGHTAHCVVTTLVSAVVVATVEGVVVSVVVFIVFALHGVCRAWLQLCLGCGGV